MNEQEWLNMKPLHCDNCRKSEHFLQPHVQKGTFHPIVFWSCPKCTIPFPGLEAMPVTYMHSRFPPGIQVYIRPAVLETYEKFQYAGRFAVTCEGIFFPMLEGYGERQRTKVPVRFSDGYECFLEERYVEKL